MKTRPHRNATALSKRLDGARRSPSRLARSPAVIQHPEPKDPTLSGAVGSNPSPCVAESNPPASLPTIIAEAERRIALSKRPATDDQLARIWPAWNALPANMEPWLRRRILTNYNPNARPEHRVYFENLRRQFPELDLPFDRNEYHFALRAAEGWAKLIAFYRTTVTLFKAAVETQWAFNEADNQAEERIAIYRAAQESSLIHPGLLECKAPNLADIALLQDRYTAYAQAREDALNALADLLYKTPGIRAGRTLPPEEQAFGLPWPPDNVPHYLYIARLDALGLCSQPRFAKFITQDFLKLDREKRNRFYEFSLKPHYGKEPYAALRVWLLDNRPIFEHPQFTWQWQDVQTAAVEKGIECPPTSLKQWASRNRLGVRLKRGPTPTDESKVMRSKPLLSPAPVFGDVLKTPRQ